MAFRSPGCSTTSWQGPDATTGAGCGCANASARSEENLVGFTAQGQGEVAAVGGQAGEDAGSGFWISGSGLLADDIVEEDGAAIEGVGDGRQLQFGADGFFDCRPASRGRRRR